MFLVSSNPVTILAADSKKRRQAVLRDPENKDRQTAAAIEIQRVYRGYILRCRLFNIVHGGISNETQGHHSSYRWSDLSGRSSQDSQGSEILVPGYISRQQSRIPSSKSRQKLEEDFSKFKEIHSSISFEDYCALVIQSWWHQVWEERNNIRVPSVRPPTMADSYSTLSGRIYRRSRGATRMARAESAKIIQRAWRKHVVSVNL